MKRKEYKKPEMQAVSIRCSHQLLGSSPVNRVGGGTFNESVQGGSGSARGRSYEDWDEDY